MIYSLTNYETGKSEYIENDENLANARLKELQNRWLELNNDLFTFLKEIVDGNNTTWISANLENDIENCRYHLFNPVLGQHETTNSFTEAKQKLNEIKENYLKHIGLDKWVIVDEIPQPKAIGLTTL